MNKTLKTILIIVNIGMLVLAIFWYKKEKEYEPLIVLLGQVVVLIGFIFENPVSKVFTKGINNSNVKVKKRDGDSIHTEDVVDSEIDIS